AVGECALSGRYKTGTGPTQAFVANQHKGIWGAAIELPGTEALNVDGIADANAISCGSPGVCAAGGQYYAVGPHYQAFVADGSAPCVVPRVIGKTVAAAKRALSAAFCRPGTIKKAFSKTRRGRVAAQKPKPRTRLKNGGRVALTVSKGPKP